MFVEYFMEKLTTEVNAWNVTRQASEPNRILCKTQVVLTKTQGYSESMVAYIDITHKFHKANIQISLGIEQSVAMIQSMSWKEKRKSGGKRSIVHDKTFNGPLFYFDFGAPEFDNAALDRIIAMYVTWLDEWAKPLYHVEKPR